ncbi:MAG: OadG family protein [Bacteroidaceae bacterium]|nr:OadG family protein [Bacteroidaceae bacterium]
MEYLDTGLKLLVIGMVTVMIVLLIVIWLGKGIIAVANKFPEVQAQKPVSKQNAQVDAKTRKVLDAAVSQITGGKGHITNITVK